MGGGKDIEGAQINGFYPVCAPVAPEIIELFRGILDIFSIDPIYHINAFTSPRREQIHTADVARAAQKTGGFGICRSSDNSCCRECPKQSAS